MTQKNSVTPDYDSPWKEVLELYFEQFMYFFFQTMYAEIDWSRGHQFLDKELQKVVRAAKTGRRLVDKLVKVWRQDGSETWVLIHIEIQGQVESEFTRRMYQYHYRLYDRYAQQIVSLAILTDEQSNWRPNQFTYSLWGCQLDFKFPAIKLLDYKEQRSELTAGNNPFALVTLAHLEAQATRQQPEERFKTKLRLTKLLYQQGYSRQQILELYRFIDWVLQLPAELEEKFAHVIYKYEEAKRMKYITNIERQSIKQGVQQGLALGIMEGIELGLELRFGQDGKREFTNIRKISNSVQLRSIFESLKTAKTLEELRRIYSNPLEKN